MTVYSVPRALLGLDGRLDVLPCSPNRRGEKGDPLHAKTLSVCLLVCSSLLIACGGSSGIPVTEAEYGEEWPFTIPRGTLECERESVRSERLFVTLDDGTGIMYGLNGSAQDFGYPTHRDILKPGKTSADVQPLITRGLTLCK